jgi:REP element-mobilizing transposase RayT
MKSRSKSQGALAFSTGWGGARPGSGRKPNGEKAGVSHRMRTALHARFPVLVTLRLCAAVPNLRRVDPLRVICWAFQGGRERFGFRLIHYSIQTNHVHLLVEAEHSVALARGMQGLGVRIARALNRLWGRKGSVFDDRYHERILRTPREVRNALVYVLQNARKHGHRFQGGPDPFSSGRWFDGWRDFEGVGSGGSPVAPARTWLLRKGWRRFGRIGVGESPGVDQRLSS